MTQMADLLDRHFSAWNEIDADSRSDIIKEVWSPNGRLIDPPMAAEGHEAINNMMAALHQQFPEHSFRRSSEIDSHNGHFRFSWDLIAPNGTIALSGTDVGEIDDRDQLTRITGFFGPLSPLS